MLPFKIGNWLITDTGIKWDGEPNVDYLIPTDRLLELGNGGRDTMYSWLVHMPEKTWTTKDDIYALNTAFIYALSYFNLPFNTGSFVATLREQQRQIEEK